jgi:hypothetical protein
MAALRRNVKQAQRDEANEKRPACGAFVCVDTAC